MSVRIRIAFLALILSVVFPAHSPAAGTVSAKSPSTTVVVDGASVEWIWMPRSGGLDRLVSLADFARATGAAYSFYPGTGDIVISRGERVLELCMDRRKALINGSGFTLKQPPRTADGVIYIPLGAAASALGYTISNDQTKNILYVTQNPPGIPSYRDHPAAGSAIDLLPPGSEFITAGETVVKGDVDGDGHNEYAALYRKNDGKYGVVLYSAKNGRYGKIWFKEEDLLPELIDISDLNGGGCELLLGWELDEALGSYLEIYTVSRGSPELIFSGLYHRIDRGDFDGDGKNEFAVWQKDTENTYSVSLYKWGGSMFTPREYHPEYYSGVIDYYKNLSVDDAQKRAVTYYLAEAFLRSREFGQSLQAAEEGLRYNQGHIPNSHFYGIKGLALVGLERFEDALLYLQKSLEGKPGTVWPEARFALSRCYLETGNIEKGRLELIRALNEGNGWQGFERARETLRSELMSDPD